MTQDVSPPHPGAGHARHPAPTLNRSKAVKPPRVRFPGPVNRALDRAGKRPTLMLSGLAVVTGLLVLPWLSIGVVIGAAGAYAAVVQATLNRARLRQLRERIADLQWDNNVKAARLAQLKAGDAGALTQKIPMIHVIPVAGGDR